MLTSLVPVLRRRLEHTFRRRLAGFNPASETNTEHADRTSPSLENARCRSSGRRVYPGVLWGLTVPYPQPEKARLGFITLASVNLPFL
jgi:hypothetical protein